MAPHPTVKLATRGQQQQQQQQEEQQLQQETADEASSATSTQQRRRRRGGDLSTTPAPTTSATPPPTRDELQSYIPLYLRRYVLPYHGDFCYTPIFHPKLIGALMMEGFLPIATEGMVLPKLHAKRCVIHLPDALHVSKSVRKKAKDYTISVNTAFRQVVEGCRTQHGDHCWLYPELVAAFAAIHLSDPFILTLFDPRTGQPTAIPAATCAVRLYSVEVWNKASGDLVAGELGYSVGSIYTSLTGFTAQDSAGSIQLAALGRWLSQQGFRLWDLGMEMEYKRTLGARLMPRHEFIAYVHAVRHGNDHIRLPNNVVLNCKDVIDQAQPQATSTATSTATTTTAPPQQNADSTNKVKKDPGRKKQKHK